MGAIGASAGGPWTAALANLGASSHTQPASAANHAATSAFGTLLGLDHAQAAPASPGEITGLQLDSDDVPAPGFVGSLASHAVHATDGDSRSAGVAGTLAVPHSPSQDAAPAGSPWPVTAHNAGVAGTLAVSNTPPQDAAPAAASWPVAAHNAGLGVAGTLAVSNTPSQDAAPAAVPWPVTAPAVPAPATPGPAPAASASANPRHAALASASPAHAAPAHAAPAKSAHAPAAPPKPAPAHAHATAAHAAPAKPANAHGRHAKPAHAHAAHARPAHVHAAHPRHARPMPSPFEIYDSVTPSAIPHGHQVATYVNGAYAASASDVASRGHVLWIDTNGSDTRADVLDVEPGDATPAGAAAWVKAKLSASPHSIAILYTMISQWQAVRDNVGALPSSMQSHVRYWIADPTGVPHVLPGSNATQWYWGNSYDITTANPGFES